jgi:hypothetical protein
MDELYRAFVQISGQQTLEMAQATYALADVVEQLRPQLESTAAATVTTKKPSTENTDTEGPFTKVLKSAFGIAPIVGGLLDLFSTPDEPPPLLKYAMPSAVNFAAADTQNGFSSVDYDQTGQARAYRLTADAAVPPGGRTYGAKAQNAAPFGLGAYESATGVAAPVNDKPAPQITVNVQAMDARSFLDRSGDIALAVRDAMLNLNSINDVVNDL